VNEWVCSDQKGRFLGVALGVDQEEAILYAIHILQLTDISTVKPIFKPGAPEYAYLAFH
jgi:hypothetical protein